MLFAPETFSPTRPRLECDHQQEWHIRGFAEAKQLMMGDVRQASFAVETAGNLPNTVRPIIWLDGPDHHEQRKQIAKFFTPAMIERYIPIMQRHADHILADFQQQKRADLNRMATELAASVVAEIVGFTESPLSKSAVRIENVLDVAATMHERNLKFLWKFIKVQWYLGKFWFFDVRPAIKARRLAPKNDVISHLLAKNEGIQKILTEALTYGVAGMTTTRELTAVAFWHCMINPQLRAIMTSDDQEARFHLLYEIVRIDPIVGILHRRATAPITLESDGNSYAIAPEAMLHFHIRDINTDARVLGENAVFLGLERNPKSGVPHGAMSFGTGHHHCPGEYIAIAQADLFLHRLLQIESIKIEQEPKHHFSETLGANELKKFVISC